MNIYSIFWCPVTATRVLLGHFQDQMRYDFTAVEDKWYSLTTQKKQSVFPSPLLMATIQQMLTLILHVFSLTTQKTSTPPPTIPQYKVCNRNTYGPQCMNVPPPQSQTCRLVHGTAPTNSTFRCFPALPLGFKVHRMSIQSVCMYGPKGSCTESKDFEKVYEIDFCRLVSELVAAC